MYLESDANYRVVNERSLGHKNRQFTMECSLNGVRVTAYGGNKKAAKKAAAQKMLDIILVSISNIIYHTNHLSHIIKIILIYHKNHNTCFFIETFRLNRLKLKPK